MLTGVILDDGFLDDFSFCECMMCRFSKNERAFSDEKYVEIYGNGV